MNYFSLHRMNNTTASYRWR